MFLFCYSCCWSDHLCLFLPSVSLGMCCLVNLFLGAGWLLDPQRWLWSIFPSARRGQLMLEGTSQSFPSASRPSRGGNPGLFTWSLFTLTWSVVLLYSFLAPRRPRRPGTQVWYYFPSLLASLHWAFLAVDPSFAQHSWKKPGPTLPCESFLQCLGLHI